MRCIAVVLVLVGCSRSSEDCKRAFDDYERTWKAAFAQDAREMDPAGGTFVVEAGDAMIGDTLPRSDELARIREVHRQGSRGGVEPPDSLWPAAWAAAEHAIDVCGEGARRPR